MPMNSPWSWPFWIAHRGAGKSAPENTLAAFRAGFSAGFGMFECDVKLSADGVAFLLHDDDLDRTTSGHGPAGARTWAELSRLDAGAWQDRAFAGEPLPTLEALARWARANGGLLNLEIKPSPGAEQVTGEQVAREASALWSGADTPPLLSSFSVEALRAAAQAAPSMPRALLLERLHDGWHDDVEALGAVAVVLHFPLADAATIARVHAGGRRALAYTVNEEAAYRRLRMAGIDGLITDAISRFGPLARSTRRTLPR